jgi:hypothetical protein
MFSALVLAATTLRESVQLVVSLVTGMAFAVACIVTEKAQASAFKPRVSVRWAEHRWL